MPTFQHLAEVAKSAPLYKGANSAQASPAPRSRRGALGPTRRNLSALVLTGALAACGGGGGDSPATSPSTAITTSPGVAITAPAPVFRLRDAYVNFLSHAYSQTFSISGSGCSGTQTLAHSAPSAVPAGSNARFSFVSSSTFDVRTCPGAPAGAVNVRLFDDMYRALGSVAAGGANSIYEPPVSVPEIVNAGDPGGILSTESIFGTSTSTVPDLKTVLSYSILPDTATSVLTRFMTQTFDARSSPNRLLVTQTATYRLGADGTFLATSGDILFPADTNGGLHLILTAQ